MSTKKSLADKISGLLHAAPSYNPDDHDDNDTETAAKVVDYDDENAEEKEAETNNQSSSAFRKKNVSLLDEIDSKYAGKKSSRKELYDSDDDLQPEYIDQESPSEDDDEEEENDSNEAEGSSEDEDMKESIEDDDNFKHIKETSLKVINKKSKCVQSQIKMWESLLEMRIQLQKCLAGSNKLPPPAIYKEMRENNEFVEKTESLKRTLGNTVGNLIELQELLIRKFPESKNVLKETKQKTKEKHTSDKDDEEPEEDDEEIPSDTEDENDDNDAEESEDDEPTSKKKKFSIPDLETKANKLHQSYTNFRNTTIQTWNDKTQIAHGKTANTNPILAQIEYNLTDKPRLVKRTQLKRSEYKILGVEDIEMEEEITRDHEYNNNIFDDDDFYHQLLRELIEVKSADITDPIQLSRQWIQLQNLRSKMKRKIDTKATKGRKIRYGIHTKLVNFMAPVNNEFITDEAQMELFSSLFGTRA